MTGMAPEGMRDQKESLATFIGTNTLPLYPKIEPRHGRMRCRYAASISPGGTGFLEFSHQVSIEMKVDTTE